MILIHLLFERCSVSQALFITPAVLGCIVNVVSGIFLSVIGFHFCCIISVLAMLSFFVYLLYGSLLNRLWAITVYTSFLGLSTLFNFAITFYFGICLIKGSSGPWKEKTLDDDENDEECFTEESHHLYNKVIVAFFAYIGMVFVLVACTCLLQRHRKTYISNPQYFIRQHIVPIQNSNVATVIRQGQVNATGQLSNVHSYALPPPYSHQVPVPSRQCNHLSPTAPSISSCNSFSHQHSDANISAQIPSHSAHFTYGQFSPELDQWASCVAQMRELPVLPPLSTANNTNDAAVNSSEVALNRTCINGTGNSALRNTSDGQPQLIPLQQSTGLPMYQQSFNPNMLPPLYSDVISGNTNGYATMQPKNKF